MSGLMTTKTKTKAARRQTFKYFLIFLYLSTFAVVVIYLTDGLNYYLLPYTDRPRHPDYRILKPGGLLGHGFGILGSAMMILMLLYSVRKRFKRFAKWGSLGRWLDIHIYFGLMGPLFIILHTTFKLNGLVAVSFWSMIAVALSGIVGRYLYLQIPRNIRGHELTLSEAGEMDRQLTERLRNEFWLDDDALGEIENLIIGREKSHKTAIGTLFSMVTGDVARSVRSIFIKREIRRKFNIPGDQIEPLINVARQKAMIRHRLTLWSRTHQLFHHWHVFHKPFAIIMYLIMIIHIIVTVVLGYRWIF